jgi:exodeoxyribonuclease VII small subunit
LTVRHSQNTLRAVSAKATRKPAEEPHFDQLLDQLRQVVARLESGSLGLEESLATYESGVGLARKAHAILDRAEKRVEVLVKVDERGAAVTTPLTGDDDDEDDEDGDDLDEEDED